MLIKLQNQPLFVLLCSLYDVFPAKWRLRNDCRNSILMTCRFRDLSSASDWLKQISLAARPIRSTTQIWVVKRHQYGISALVLQTSLRGEDSGGVANCSSDEHEVLWEKCTLFEFQYISHFSTNWERYIYVSYWRRDRHFTWSSSYTKVFFFFRAKAVPSLLCYCKSLSIDPVPKI